MKIIVKLAKVGIAAFVVAYGFYIALWIFSLAELAYKTNIEFPVIENVAECAVIAYLEREGYQQDVKQISCGVDKMEDCLVEVFFLDDPLVYTYRYNLEQQGIELLWVSNCTSDTGAPKHFPEYDETKGPYVLYYYGIDDYLLDHEFSKCEAYKNEKIFHSVLERKGIVLIDKRAG